MHFGESSQGQPLFLSFFVPFSFPLQRVRDLGGSHLGCLSCRPRPASAQGSRVLAKMWDMTIMTPPLYNYLGRVLSWQLFSFGSHEKSRKRKHMGRSVASTKSGGHQDGHLRFALESEGFGIFDGIFFIYTISSGLVL